MDNTSTNQSDTNVSKQEVVKETEVVKKQEVDQQPVIESTPVLAEQAKHVLVVFIKIKHVMLSWILIFTTQLFLQKVKPTQAVNIT